MTTIELNTKLEAFKRNVIKPEKQDYTFWYQMLDKLRCDCEYFLGYGNRGINSLYGDTVELHLAYMEALLASFPKRMKPEWLTEADLENYRELMV